MTYNKDKIVSLVIIILHLVGAIGSAIPATREIVTSLTPVNLLITAGLLIYTHRESYPKLAVFLPFSMITGFLIEVVGVATGFPFGEYAYGNTLGFQIMNVPLLIGVNWFILSYSFGMMTANLRINWLLKSILSATGMVLLDVFIEPIAIRFDYWHWALEQIPMSNYVGSFFVALFIQLVFHQLFKENLNKQSALTVGCQAFYFSFLQIFFKF